MINKGCYGSVICNNDKSEVCKRCSLANACFELVKENTDKIKARLEIDVSKQERRNFQRDVVLGNPVIAIPNSGKRESLTDYQQSIIDNPLFPIKARKLTASLFRKGITGGYLRALLNKKVNPFSNSTPMILNIACRLILLEKMSLPNLRAAFKYAGQSDKTALSQAHTVITSFLLMGVLTKDLKLKGNQ